MGKRIIQGGPKKAPYFDFHLKVVFYNFFHIFQVVQTAGLGDSFGTDMDAIGYYTTQQQIKIIEAYFATKSVLLTQRQCRTDFGRNNVDHCGLCGHLPHFLSPKIWPPNVELSFYLVHCSCQNLSCFTTVSEELVLWQSMPQ